jgi:hypothetical protein
MDLNMWRQVILVLVLMLGGFSVTSAANRSLLDEQMAEVADYFAGKIRGDHEVLFADKLDRSKLDLSLASLHAVDAWLKVLLAAKVDPDSQAAAETLVWAGAYVGEVIRACSTRSFTWMRYDEYMADQEAKVRDMIPHTFGTQFMLASRTTKAMTLPLNKVVRFLAEGPENNLHYYAAGLCAE